MDFELPEELQMFRDSVREFAARALRQYGYSALVARRAQEALLIAAEHPGVIDVVLGSDLVAARRRASAR